MNEQTLNAIKELFSSVGQKIGQGAEWGWPILVKQQIVNGWISLSYSLLGVLILIFGSWGMSKLIKYTKEEKELWTGIIFGFIAVFVIGGSLLFINFTNSIQCFVNPEYMALMSLNDLIK